MTVAQPGEHPEAQPAAHGHATRTVAVIGGLVLLLVVAAVVASLLLDSGKPASYPADSPEYAFQRYYQAVQNRDIQTAYAAFSSRVQQQLSYDQFAWYADQMQQPSESSTAVRIDHVDRGDTQAVLSLTLERTFGTGLGANRVTESRSVRLIQENGSWKIDDPVVGTDLIIIAPKS